MSRPTDDPEPRQSRFRLGYLWTDSSVTSPPASGCWSGIRRSHSAPILTLGLGIGLSTTVFCVVNGGLFKGLPFPNADRIVSVFSTNPVAGAAATADRRARPGGFAGAADLVRRRSGRTPPGRYNLSLGRRPAGAVSGRAADAGGVPRARRAADARPRLPGGRRQAGRRTSSCSATTSGATATAAPRTSSAGRFAPTARSSPSSA